MSHTKEFTATQAAWLLVATGEGHAFLQLEKGGPVKVHTGQTIPSVGVYTGVTLDDKGLQEIAIDPLEVGDSVWIRSTHDEDNLVTVMGPGNGV